MDLSTTYLGLELPHPFIPGAGPLGAKLDTVRRLEDAGAAAITLHSLFEEQIVQEQMAAIGAMEDSANSSAEAMSYFPELDAYRLGTHEYLEHLRSVKEAVDVPVIGSLNGNSLGGWLDYAKLIQEAGADALELNVYYLATSIHEPGLSIRQLTMDMVSEVKKTVNIPVAVKLSPFYTSVANAAKSLHDAGADGFVLFNRFYQADIDIEELEVLRTLQLSDSSELLLRLRWLAVLSGRLPASLAVSGGVHTHEDAIKAIMCGADVVQMVSCILENGPWYLAKMRDAVAEWMEQHEYDSLRQMKGSMSLERCPEPKAYERANYMHILSSWES